MLTNHLVHLDQLQASSTGQDLLDVVIKHLNLLETSYFGLKYLRKSSNGCASSANATNQTTHNDQSTSCSLIYQQQQQQQQQVGEHVWLDVERSALKQLRQVQPMTVYFGVKYYAANPCKLAEEITRYQFFLQCKQDILAGRLPVHFELATELFALAIQSELGDFDPKRHHDNYAQEFAFVATQSHELERRAMARHRQLTGQVPATAELNFLEQVKFLDLYGCQLHPIQYDDETGDAYALGLNPSGVLVLRNRLKVAQYAWSRIVKTKCQGRCFLMDVIELPATTHSLNAGDCDDTLTTAQQVAAQQHQRPGSGGAQRNRFGFRLADKEAARVLRDSLEQRRSFYHLIHSSATLQQLARRQLAASSAASSALAAAAAAAAEQQQQQMKFSQRFRNSIRSAISVGGGHSSSATATLQRQLARQQAAAVAQLQHEHHLRASMKSLGHPQQVAAAAQAMMLQQQQYSLDCAGLPQQPPPLRPPPSVVRMPSRRYSNRSLQRPSGGGGGSQQVGTSYTANSNGLPPVVGGGVGVAHTMVESQRQQALLMMNQFNQMGASMPASRSQTLRPVSSKHDTKGSSKRSSNAYHQMMMMFAAQQQQQQQSAAAHARNQHPEVAILPPGQHIVQPSVYRASSIVNGMNQLGLGARGQQQQAAEQQQHQSLMQQFFNTRPQYPTAGHESPRSTKSAMAPSNAMKLASKKLAKQQQQFLYGQQQQQQQAAARYSHHLHQRQLSDTRPLLRSEEGAEHYSSPDYYQQQQQQQQVMQHSSMAPYSANASPRSARSTRLASSSSGRHRSKSTGENLHLLHLQQHHQHPPPHQQAPPVPHQQNKMLLTTAAPLLLDREQQPPPQRASFLPPPDYNSAAGQPQAQQARQRRGRIQASGQQVAVNAKRNVLSDEDEDDDAEDDYYCSRSDCSSIVADNNKLSREQFASASASAGKQRQARFINGQLVNSSLHQKQTQQTKRTRRPSTLASSKSQEALNGLEEGQIIGPNDQHQQREWNAIRRRHNEFSSGKGLLLNQQPLDPTALFNQHRDTEKTSHNHHNEGRHAAAVVKNIANKQATPILLSMTYDDHDEGVESPRAAAMANSKAVQLLNYQRQQLNSQSSTASSADSNNNNNSGSGGDSNSNGKTSVANGQLSNSSGNSSFVGDSAPSSVASSPKAGGQPPVGTLNSTGGGGGSATNSTASTTSGYYAGSNSTGPASVDSDTGGGGSGQSQGKRATNDSNNNWSRHESGSRAKIALGAYSAKTTPFGGASATTRPVGSQATPTGGQYQQQQLSVNQSNNRNKQFFLGDNPKGAAAINNQEDSNHRQSQTADKQRQWSPMEQVQQHAPSSLKYVSFDV